jgi:eukaryotic-like serine/threonine-protein kinase
MIAELVQVYDIGTLEDGRPYFVMDYIDGGSLDDLRPRGIHPGPALRLCADACRALDVLHSNDIIHRDVTPGNLLINRAQRWMSICTTWRRSGRSSGR